MRFDALNLYYVHGRWYNPDTGLFLSPDENGEYRYGSGQDAVNWAWRVPPSQSCIFQVGMSDCEKFVDEVRRFISLAQSAGASDDLTVQLLAQYYAGIRATWQIGPLTLPAIGGVFGENPFFQDPTFPTQIRDRWLPTGPVHNPLDNREGHEARRKYGFKRIFFENTHHYFAVFYQAWFWGSPFTAAFNEWRERDQNNNPDLTKRQPYDEGMADIAVGQVAMRHVELIKKIRFSPQYGAVRGDFYAVIPGKAIQRLPELLAQDACGTSDQEIYVNWPRADIEKILGPRAK